MAGDGLVIAGGQVGHSLLFTSTYALTCTTHSSPHPHVHWCLLTQLDPTEATKEGFMEGLTEGQRGSVGEGNSGIPSLAGRRVNNRAFTGPAM